MIGNTPKRLKDTSQRIYGQRKVPGLSRIGFTLVEMLVVIAIIGILAALLMPGLRKALQSAYKVQCANNLKQIHIGFTLYNSDYRDYFPPNYIKHSSLTFAGITRTGCYVPWYGQIYIGQYIDNRTICSSAFPTSQQKITSNVLDCPSYQKPKWDSIGYSGYGDFGFGYNPWVYKNFSTGKIINMRDIKVPSKTFLLIDTALGYEVKHTYDNPSADKWSRYWWPKYRHPDSCNTLFVAGNVNTTFNLREEISSGDIKHKIW